MVILETNKDKVSLINQSTPLVNLVKDPKDSKQFYEQISAFISWTEHYPQVDINKLTSKVSQFEKIMKSKALAVKVLGSGSYKNHIWIVNTNNRPYIIYLSLRGLSIETLPQSTSEEILKDLQAIAKEFKFKPFPFKKYL